MLSKVTKKRKVKDPFVSSFQFEVASLFYFLISSQKTFLKINQNTKLGALVSKDALLTHQVQSAYELAKGILEFTGSKFET